MRARFWLNSSATARSGASAHNTSDELMVGRALMGSGYTMMNDPNEPYRVEALADAESQVQRADEVRARARTHFEGSVDYLEGDRRDEAKRVMEQSL
ncbi:hypothetical protein LCGC14_2843290, partial [marine sediment metagenome]